MSVRFRWFIAIVLTIVVYSATASAVSPTPALASGCTGYQLAPSQAASVPVIVKSQPAGTTFCLAAGTYPLTSTIKLLAGDQFIGAGSGLGGTELRGDKPISAWTFAGGLYQHSGDVISLPLSGVCTSGTACQYADWLFSGGWPLARTIAPCTTANVVPGTFCIDYSTGTMYVFDDPAAAQISYSYVPQAISRGSGVFISSLAVDYFASIASTKPAVVVGDNSTVDGLSAGWNHACGVQFLGTSPTVRSSHLHDNGQLGLCGNISTGASVTSNEIDHNDTLGFSTGWAAGGAKVNGSVNANLSGNSIHDNAGRGLWLDNDNIGMIVDNNTATGNTDDGLRIEISCSSKDISGNTLTNNAGDGLSVNNSHDISVGVPGLPNMVSGNASQGIVIKGGARKSNSTLTNCGTTAADYNNRVIGNDITMPPGASTNGMIGAIGVTISGNLFDANIYQLPGTDCGAKRWFWWNGSSNIRVTFPGWQALGQDTSGSCSSY